MTNKQPQQQYAIGMVGLGVMGRNLLLNMADHDFSVAGYDKDPAKVAALRQEAKQRGARGAADIKEFIALLLRPRAVMLLVPAGPPVHSVINDLLAHLQPVEMRLTNKESFDAPSPDAYETLLLDVMNNDPTLFMRADQVEAAWQILMPVLEVWAVSNPRNFPNYAAGSWGPKVADELLAREGHAWRAIA
jgi:Glucose-6-phosphate dehydrogenase, C-terminal domain/NAD binding domain of 6-phosphogluconate dehydrogenase